VDILIWNPHVNNGTLLHNAPLLRGGKGCVLLAVGIPTCSLTYCKPNRQNFRSPNFFRHRKKVPENLTKCTYYKYS